MAPPTMTHLGAGSHPGRVRMASRRFAIGVLLGLALALPGCYHHELSYPDEIRAASPCPCSLVINGPWQQVHQAVTAAVQHMTAGPYHYYSTQHPIEPELGRGTVYRLHVRWPGRTGLAVEGFVADVERLTENTTKLTIYPVDEQWKGITRQKIADVVERQFPPPPDAPS